MNKELVIAIDPGMGGIKIVMNEHMYLVPFAVEDITKQDKSSQILFTSDDRITYHGKDGSVYLVGRVARDRLMQADIAKTRNEDNKLDDFYDIRRRFSSEEFRIGVDAAIGYAMMQYEKEDDGFSVERLSDYEIRMGVAYPHALQQELWDATKDYLKGRHDFRVTVGTCERKVLFTPTDVSYNSQAICALFNVAFSGETEFEDINGCVPALIIDAGYKTVGYFQLSYGATIDKAASDQNFAMYNINDSVAAELSRYIPTIRGYLVEARMQSRQYEIGYKDSDNVTKKINILPIHSEAVCEKCDEMYKELVGIFDFANLKTIIFAGGTGALYYEHTEQWRKENPDIKFVLADSGFESKCDPIFGVAIGLYKALRNF